MYKTKNYLLLTAKSRCSCREQFGIGGVITEFDKIIRFYFFFDSSDCSDCSKTLFPNARYQITAHCYQKLPNQKSNFYLANFKIPSINRRTIIYTKFVLIATPLPTSSQLTVTMLKFKAPFLCI